MIKKIKKIYRLLFKSQPKHTLSYITQIERHGTIYGGWNILPNSLNSASIVYSFGIGEDISFDLSLIKKYGCTIQAFDPTPKVINWLKAQQFPNNFKFHPLALSNEDGVLTFYSPKDENHISHTITSNPASKAVEVACKKIESIALSLSHKQIDLLKMDIEGFEYIVLDDLLNCNIRPKQLLVEFHHFFPEIGNKKTEDMLQKLQDSDYHLFAVADSFCEYSFVYKPFAS